MYNLNLSINKIPKSLNKLLRKHGFARLKDQKEWDLYLALLIGRQKPIEPLSKARVSIVRHYYRFLDFDGLVGSCKPVVDALTNNGIIKDDSWPVLGAWEVEQLFRPKKDGFLLELKISSECN